MKEMDYRRRFFNREAGHELQKVFDGSGNAFSGLCGHLASLVRASFMVGQPHLRQS
jgi:hypothetical protein